MKSSITSAGSDINKDRDDANYPCVECRYACPKNDDNIAPVRSVNQPPVDDGDDGCYQKPVCTKCKRSIEPPLVSSLASNLSRLKASANNMQHNYNTVLHPAFLQIHKSTSNAATLKRCPKCHEKSTGCDQCKVTPKDDRGDVSEGKKPRPGEAKLSGKVCDENDSNVNAESLRLEVPLDTKDKSTCNTTLKQQLGKEDNPNDYIFLNGPVYVKKGCMDEKTLQCKRDCCAEVEQVPSDPFTTCKDCCLVKKCGKLPHVICDEENFDAIEEYARVYLGDRVLDVQDDEFDPYGEYVPYLNRTHGEDHGEVKYHFLMRDAACSVNSKGNMAGETHVQSPTDVGKAPSAPIEPENTTRESGASSVLSYHPDCLPDETEVVKKKNVEKYEKDVAKSSIATPTDQVYTIMQEPELEDEEDEEKPKAKKSSLKTQFELGPPETIYKDESDHILSQPSVFTELAKSEADLNVKGVRVSWSGRSVDETDGGRRSKTADGEETPNRGSETKASMTEHESGEAVLPPPEPKKKKRCGWLRKRKRKDSKQGGRIKRKGSRYSTSKTALPLDSDSDSSSDESLESRRSVRVSSTWSKGGKVSKI